MTEELHFGRYKVEVTNRGKVLFPENGITKGELIDYYLRISDVMLPHVEGRPVMMQRFPDGIGEYGFYQKEVPDHFPSWVRTVAVKTVEGKTVTHVVCENTATLAYMAQEAVITPHIWLSRADMLHHPDKIVFDLDPSGGDFEPVRAAALSFRELLDEVGLTSFVMTTGSRGLHVVLPLRRGPDFDEVRSVAMSMARALAERHPDELTTEQYKNKRRGRLFLDTNRNAYGQTGVAPYAVRAREGAPVATPLDWEELRERDLGPRSFGIRNIFRRLGQKDDPWKNMFKRSQSLDGVAARLEKVRGESA